MKRNPNCMLFSIEKNFYFTLTYKGKTENFYFQIDQMDDHYSIHFVYPEGEKERTVAAACSCLLPGVHWDNDLEVIAFLFWLYNKLPDPAAVVCYAFKDSFKNRKEYEKCLKSFDLINAQTAYHYEIKDEEGTYIIRPTFKHDIGKEPKEVHVICWDGDEEYDWVQNIDESSYSKAIMADEFSLLTREFFRSLPD